MKKFIFMLFFFVTLTLELPSLGSTLKIIGPCDSKPIFEIQTQSKASNLGDFTVQEFQKHKIPFAGDRSGIKAIFDSPSGDEALEILSDIQMRAYGWCVTVNGEASDLMPEDVLLDPDEPKDVVWFYAYAFYDRGEWKEFCTPSYKVRSLSICESSSAQATKATLH